MTGLVGWWPLNEDSGKARDLSGNGNHGSLNGGVTQGVAGKGGLTAYSFDGQDDSVNTGLSTDTTTAQTWSLWIYPRQWGHGTYQNDRALSDQFHDIRVNTDDEIVFRWNDGLVSAVYGANRWYHVVMVYDGDGTLEGFVDGTSIGTASLTESDDANNWIIGSNPNSDVPFDGLVSEVRFYNRALSPQEIQTLYDWGNGDYASPPNDRTDPSAVSRWDFDGDVKDSWGGNDGTDNTSAGFSSDAVRGQAKNFDGSDDSVTVGQPAFSDTITLSLWAKPSRFGNSSGDFEGQLFNSSTTDSFVLTADETGVWRYRIYDSSSKNNYTIDASGELNEWVNLTVVLDNGLMRFYKNGLQVGSNSTGISFEGSSTDAAIFGDINSSSNRHFKGKIDEARLYNRALSQDEIFELYQYGTRGRDMRKLTVNKR